MGDDCAGWETVGALVAIEGGALTVVVDVSMVMPPVTVLGTTSVVVDV